MVIVRFELTVDPAVAAQDVREKIALVKPLLRHEVKEPLVIRFDPDDAPVISLAMRSDGCRRANSPRSPTRSSSAGSRTRAASGGSPWSARCAAKSRST